MKKTLKFSSLIPILFLSIWLLGFSAKEQKKTESKMPQPTEVIKLDREAKKKFKQDRKAWIESLHKTKKGVNWRDVDRKNMESKLHFKMASRKEFYLKHKNRVRSIQTILHNNQISPSPALAGMSMAAEVEKIADGAINGTWHEKGSNNLSGRIMETDVDFNEGVIYALSAGGVVWAGDLNGNNWQPLNDFMRINGGKNILALPMSGFTRITVLNDNHMFYTDNSGATWDTATGLPNPDDWGQIERMVITRSGSSSIIYVLALGWNYTTWRSEYSIYKSTNNGEIFTKTTYKSSPKVAPFLWTPKYNSNMNAYILEDNQLYRYDQYGSKTQLSTLPSTISMDTVNQVRLTGVVKGTETILYALLETEKNSHVFVSSNGGTSWTKKTTINDSKSFTHNSFCASAVDINAVYMGSVEVFRSFNKSDSWQKVNDWWAYYSNMEDNLHADVPHIGSFIDNSGRELILVSTDGGIYRSDDGLRTVNNITLEGLRISQYYSVYSNRTDPGIIFAGAQDQGFQRTLTDNGGILNFKQLISGDYGQIVSGDGGASVWAVYPAFTIYFPDASTQNETQYSLNFDFQGHSWMPPLMENPNDPRSVFVGGGGRNRGAYIQQVSFSGSSLLSQELAFDFSRGKSGVNISSMAYSPINSNYRYVINSDGDFFVSTNGGNNWQFISSISNFGGHYLTGSCILPSTVTLGTVYLGGSGYSNSPVFVSTNNGQTFTSMSTGMPSTMVFDMAMTADGTKIFAATEVGPYVYFISKGRWYDLAGMEGPEQTSWSVEYIESKNTARFCTYGRGIWDFEVQGVHTITASAQPNGSITPSGSVVVPKGSSQTFTITPNSGYVVYRVYVNGGNMGSVSTYTIENVQGDCSIVAYFTEDVNPPNYTITASAGPNGSITPGGSTVISKGSSLTYTITPANQSYKVDNVLIDGVSVGAVTSYTFTNITANHTIEATFVEKTPLSTVVISATAGGTITPNGTVIEYIGNQIQLTLRPATGYGVKALMIDGVSVGAVNSYTFNITLANHTINAQFELMDDCIIKTGGQSGNFNTSNAYCFKTKDPINGWGCSNMTGRTVSVTVNGQGTPVTVCGAKLPVKGTNDYYEFKISAGGYSYASIYWW